MKKSLKILIGIIIGLILIWGIIFCIDYNRCSNFKMPIFVVPEKIVNDGGSGIYRGLGYKVKVKKNMLVLQKIEMYIFDKFITGAITEIENNDSAYIKNFKLNFHQRKDLGIKTIIDKNSSEKYDYSICTFEGDVTVTIDADMVYTLEDALNQNIITADDILNQAKIDEETGICEARYYKDGGSIEYFYDEYTILKYNTIDGNKDLYIGMSGESIH